MKHYLELLLILLLLLFPMARNKNNELEGDNNPDSEIIQLDNADSTEYFTFNSEAIYEAMVEFIEPEDGLFDPENLQIENEQQQHRILYANGGHFRDGEEVYCGI